MSSLPKQTAEMLLESSNELAQSVPAAAFEFWERRDLRLLVDFYQITKTEQDRIFNELEVSLIGLFDLYLSYVASIAPMENKRVIIIIQKELASSFLALLIKSGVEDKYIWVCYYKAKRRFTTDCTPSQKSQYG